MMDNIDKKNYEKKLEASKFLLEHEQKMKNNTVKSSEPKKSEPKKLETIPEESSDDSDDSHSSIEQPKKRNMVSQRNKKSLIKVYENSYKHPTNYFCD